MAAGSGRVEAGAFSIILSALSRKETGMGSHRFDHVTYIATTPAKLWHALLDGDQTRQYWQHLNVSDWRPGSRWEHRSADGANLLRLAGRVVVCEPPHRLVLTWAVPGEEDDEAKQTRVTIVIDEVAGVSRLTLAHDLLEPGSKMLAGITEGWPKVLSSLKSLLETGTALPRLW